VPDPSWLGPFLRHPERAGVLTDFDGTLSPIVDDPAGAAPLPGAAEVLRRLAARYRLVAVVSGRPAVFLAAHFGTTGAALHGLYGLERVTADGRVEGRPDAEEWRATVAAAADRAEAEGPDLFVERKGLSVTLHYRTHPGRAEAARAWVEAEAARTGLRVHPARLSYELVPPVGRDKGAVAAELAAGLDAVCFVGDDRGDLAAFDALDRLAEAGATAVRVAVRSAEAPPDLLARADEVVDGPDGALALLERLCLPNG
jgi:trehalose 6-phosphate phosphatase